MSDKIYVGSGKERTFDDGGNIVTISIDVDKLITACKDYGFTTEAGKRIIKLKVGRRREIDQYGNSHSVEVDTWKPDPSRSTGNGSGGYTPRNGAQSSSAAPSRTATGGYAKRAQVQGSDNTGDDPFDGFDSDIPF